VTANSPVSKFLIISFILSVLIAVGINLRKGRVEIQNIFGECEVCGPRGIHNVDGKKCSAGLECKAGETTPASYCIKPGNSVRVCETDLRQTPETSSFRDWKTYTDSNYKFTLSYPPDWVYKNRCEGGAEDYPCFLSPDFDLGSPAGVLSGNPKSGGTIILFVARQKESPYPLCPENIDGYKFPCSKVEIGEFSALRSIVEGNKKLPTYPLASNTIHLSFLQKGKRFEFVGYYNDESRTKVQDKFDQILSTFKFLD